MKKEWNTIFYYFKSGFDYIFFLISVSIEFPARFTSTSLKFPFQSDFYWTLLKEGIQISGFYSKNNSVSIFIYEPKDRVLLFWQSALVSTAIQLRVDLWNKSFGVKTLVSMLCAFWKGLFEVALILQAVYGWSSWGSLWMCIFWFCFVQKKKPQFVHTKSALHCELMIKISC